jgi:hypothetical protein
VETHAADAIRVKTDARKPAARTLALIGALMAVIYVVAALTELN